MKDRYQPRLKALINMEFDSEENYKKAFSKFHRIMFKIYGYFLPGFLNIKVKKK